MGLRHNAVHPVSSQGSPQRSTKLRRSCRVLCERAPHCTHLHTRGEEHAGGCPGTTLAGPWSALHPRPRMPPVPQMNYFAARRVHPRGPPHLCPCSMTALQITNSISASPGESTQTEHCRVHLHSWVDERLPCVDFAAPGTLKQKSSPAA